MPDNIKCLFDNSFYKKLAKVKEKKNLLFFTSIF